jgi:hypothetical protein
MGRRQHLSTAEAKLVEFLVASSNAVADGVRGDKTVVRGPRNGHLAKLTSTRNVVSRS